MQIRRLDVVEPLVSLLPQAAGAISDGDDSPLGSRERNGGKEKERRIRMYVIEADKVDDAARFETEMKSMSRAIAALDRSRDIGKVSFAIDTQFHEYTCIY